MREKIFNIIQIGDKSNRVSRAFDIFITITIVSNILVTFLQTFEELDFLSGFFFAVEVITLLIFAWSMCSVSGRRIFYIRECANAAPDCALWCLLTVWWTF